MDHASIDAAHAAHTLADPLRRRLYEYVAAADDDVSRGEAADALGVQRTLAAHHLDKLAEAGLLEVTRRKVNGREGPGSGRPAKLYRRADRELSLHLPPRDYALAARVLAEAVERHGAEEALHAAAREEGRRIGAAAGRDAALPDLLRDRGYEPEPAGEALRLRNCPFHSLARAFPPLACGLNLELLRGVLEGRGEDGSRARMDPAEGRCCVTVSKNNED
ncbi:helix-turn-helix transcriptional regulator [Nocardiopsis aegyptia]|uniref:Putative ArsR family transcriptional regulator n=1 Tax=Nocardiopsis aegyptia TaxID=220378 RepID=A0A7Z0EP50_9ACTN|nr:helix-turn-helix domain-containing protein [Nocardiopsis aegyptia]NYJ35654.1 putative ArsR family transcriptional regulator [Nocardiopsis aegyptia]